MATSSACWAPAPPGVNGTVVERTTDGGDESIDKLAKKYLDADTYPFRQPGEQRLKVIIQPD